FMKLILEYRNTDEFEFIKNIYLKSSYNYPPILHSWLKSAFDNNGFSKTCFSEFNSDDYKNLYEAYNVLQYYFVQNEYIEYILDSMIKSEIKYFVCHVLLSNFKFFDFITNLNVSIDELINCG